MPKSPKDRSDFDNKLDTTDLTPSVRAAHTARLTERGSRRSARKASDGSSEGVDNIVKIVRGWGKETPERIDALKAAVRDEIGSRVPMPNASTEAICGFLEVIADRFKKEPEYFSLGFNSPAAKRAMAQTDELVRQTLGALKKMAVTEITTPPQELSGSISTSDEVLLKIGAITAFKAMGVPLNKLLPPQKY